MGVDVAAELEEDAGGENAAGEAVKQSVDIGEHAARIRSGSGFGTSLIPATAQVRAIFPARAAAQDPATLLARAAAQDMATLLDRAAA